ncbi:hypothetical protein ABZ470_28645 [Streptosporangium sp. NPDC020072]|uniref:hypothetical protein n=1 Tax=Streptosporangium sp. NPDC020072 TaxID=3154788 RepID=UPI00342C734D
MATTRAGNRRIRIIVDPALPEETATVLGDNALMLEKVRKGWKPLPLPRKRSAASLAVKGMLTALALVAAVFVGAGLLIEIVLSLTLAGLVVAAIRAAGDAEDRLSPEHVLYGLAEDCRESYLLEEDFDDAARELLVRTRTAAGSILGSRVNAEGLLDDVRNTVVLPAQEWEIARLLAKLSALRAEHGTLMAGGVTPEVSAAVRPLERVLAESEKAVVARVEAIERYAAHVARAEQAQRAHDQLRAFAERLPRYEELLAESGADALAVPEVGRLAEEADELERALRDSLGAAREVFGHLDGSVGGS